MNMNKYEIVKSSANYGLLLSEETMKMLVKMYCEDFTEEEFDEDSFGFYEELETIFDDVIFCIGEFSGVARYIDDNGNCVRTYDVIHFDHDYIYYVPIGRALNLFEAAYISMDEMIMEFKKRIGKYLPKDFDYRSNIRCIVGTYSISI